MCYSSNVYGIICFFENNNNGRFGVGMIVCEFLRWLMFFDEMNFVEQGKSLYFLHSEKNDVFMK